jgi:hypothetical protein
VRSRNAGQQWKRSGHAGLAALRELWPLLPESASVPLATDAILPVLLFFPHGLPTASVSQAEIACRVPKLGLFL